MDILLILVVLVAMISITVLIQRVWGTWSIPTFISAMLLVGFGLRAALAYTLEGYRAFGLPVEREEITIIAWIGLLGQVAFLVGLIIHARLRGAAAAPAPQAAMSPVQSRAAFTLLFGGAVLLLFLQAGGLAVLHGGFARAILTYSQRSIANTQKVGFLGTFLVELWELTVPLALGAFFYAVRGKSRIRVAASLVLIFAMMPWLMTLNGRASAVVVMWALAMVLARMIGRKLTPLEIGLGVFSMAGVVLVGFGLRLATQQHLPLGIAMAMASQQALYTLSDAMPTLDAFYIATEYVRLAGHDLFSILVAPFTVLVPRQFWADKPMFAPQLVNSIVFHTRASGLPVGLLGEGLVAMGFIGVGAFPLVIGVAAEKVDDVLNRWRGGDFLKCWFIFECCNLALNGVRVGFQAVIIGIQYAAIFYMAAKVIQGALNARVGLYTPIEKGLRRRTSSKAIPGVSGVGRA